MQLSAAPRWSWASSFEAEQGSEASEDLHRLISLLGIITVPFDADEAVGAVAAWRRFGKGRHPAGLDLGDRCSYALAKVNGSALLFKGHDFRQTDIASAPD